MAYPSPLLLLLAAIFAGTILPIAARRAPAPTPLPQPSPLRARLSHVDSGKNLTKMDIVRRGFVRDLNRLRTLAPPPSRIPPRAGKPADGFRAAIQASTGEYIMNLSVGTPPVPFTAIMDTGSDLTWTQCMPCTNCANRTSPFDPRKSSSAANVSCSSGLCKALPKPRCAGGCQYIYAYGDGSSTQGYLASDTFTMGDGGAWANSTPIVFGCAVNNQGPGLDTGISLVGLGRGPLSLVAQLGIREFSYCMATLGGDGSGSLVIGSLSDPNRTSDDPTKTVRLINNPANPTNYYVPLEGISVGRTRLRIANYTFEIGKDGSGGVIVDSGTSLTMIQEDAYDLLKWEFEAQTQLPVAGGGSGRAPDADSTADDGDGTESELDCFQLGRKNATAVKFPSLTFHFTGMDLELAPENYVVFDGADKVCLAIAATGVRSVIGNFQQQNLMMVHDLERGRLSMAPAACDEGS